MYKIFYDFFQSLTQEEKKTLLVEMYSNSTSPIEIIKKAHPFQ